MRAASPSHRDAAAAGGARPSNAHGDSRGQRTVAGFPLRDLETDKPAAAGEHGSLSARHRHRHLVTVPAGSAAPAPGVSRRGSRRTCRRGTERGVMDDAGGCPRCCLRPTGEGRAAWLCPRQVAAPGLGPRAGQTWTPDSPAVQRGAGSAALAPRPEGSGRLGASTATCTFWGLGCFAGGAA